MTKHAVRQQLTKIETVRRKYANRLNHLARITYAIEADTDFRDFDTENYEKLVTECANFNQLYTPFLSMFIRSKTLLTDTLKSEVDYGEQYYQGLVDLGINTCLLGEQHVVTVDEYIDLVLEAYDLHRQLRETYDEEE